VTRKPFGSMPDGRPVEMLTFSAGGLELSAITYGGIIVSLTAPDTRGAPANVVLGFDRLEHYFDSSPYFGAVVGRYANRIEGARFSIDGVEHHVTPNDPPNHLHGGRRGFDKRLWQAEASGDAAVILRRQSAAGEEGYPGTVDVEVRYLLGERGDLTVEYEAAADAPTHVNLTQHSYFNLRGTGDVLEHVLSINANAYLPVDEYLIPAGVAPVAGTPFDFREPSAIGKRLGDNHEQLRRGGGYDHNFVLNRSGAPLSLAARASEPSSGRTLEISTTEPGLQFYSGQAVGRRGFCLEPQHYPNSPNRPEFPPTLLRPGERYRSRTRYTFGR